jgi:hypothetical protein
LEGEKLTLTAALHLDKIRRRNLPIEDGALLEELEDPSEELTRAVTMVDQSLATIQEVFVSLTCDPDWHFVGSPFVSHMPLYIHLSRISPHACLASMRRLGIFLSNLVAATTRAMVPCPRDFLSG